MELCARSCKFLPIYAKELFLFICTSLPFFVFGFFGSGKSGWALCFNWSFLLGEWDGVGVNILFACLRGFVRCELGSFPLNWVSFLRVNAFIEISIAHERSRNMERLQE